ncbi:MAG: metallophosphoesterase [Clostridiaceae bacterium]|nr:metallophosphoesterase [Clostridiaceae bacterium]MDY5890372.1 metallophosphoesterase [Oscillospiraceae bacterium]
MQNEPLRFKDGKFKIMLLGDLHDCYDMKNNNAAEKMDDTLALIGKAVKELKPDLVIYMGDNARASTEYEMRAVISRITYPVSVSDTPFDLVFGNHDRECEVDLPTQLKLYREHENCYAFNADDGLSGYGNHNLVIKSGDGEKDIFNLWFIDSHSLYSDRSKSYYDAVHEDQIEWYKKTAKELADKNGGKVLPSLLFQHIPVPEEYELLREAKPYEKLDSVQGHKTYSDKYYMLKPEVEGYLGEGPAVPDFNSGEFAAWKETGDILGAFFGHDHMNDFAGYVDGILLAQCKTAGFRVYTDGCRSGVRLITLEENNPENVQTRMYHFKDFGLKSKSLDPYMRNVSDRQDMKLKAAGAAVGTVAAVTAAAVAANKVLKKTKKSK